MKPGIRWHLVNRWEGHGFRSHTFAATLPNGVLVKTTERYLGVGASTADELEHITTALAFVPDLEAVDPSDSGEYAALIVQEPKLDPNFYRPDPEPDLDVTNLGDTEPTKIHSRLNPDGSLTMTVDAGRIDPELDAGDFEPQGSRRGTLAAALERLKLGFRNMGAVK